MIICGKDGRGGAVVMYVRETIQILNPEELHTTAIPLNSLLRNSSHTAPPSLKTMHFGFSCIFLRTLLRIRRCKCKYIYRSICYTIMAPVRQLICECRWRKSTYTFGTKMRQFF
jgi:hypothetical protein